MTNIVSNLWRWLFMRSSQNAANPNPGAMKVSASTISSTTSGVEPIELVIEEEAIVGSALSLKKQKSIARGPNGELIRSDTNWLGFCGCGHLAARMCSIAKENSQEQGMFSKCYECQAENELLVLNGLISIVDAEWRSLVCHQCVRTTVSGRLCCPKHSVAVPDATGAPIYLGPEEQQEFKRKQIIQNTLAPFLELFCDQSPQSSSQKEIGHE